ncbi:MAG: A/G-specific adenine glycosylase [Alphaproteobacteria bacterium]|nr:A/G-specific adenine glycosylase [Alphaproteobacteria bacterium]
MNAAADIPPTDLARRLLAWYDRHRRRLPWRADPGEPPDPYRVWLSEIMLQQTTVVTVGPYFQRFTARWPSVEALAAADLDEVLSEWAGLGYYARARNLHRCAIAVAGDHGGRFPDTETGLKTLPGVGDYTAAAVAAIAFDRPATILDGNVERVIARLRRVTDPLPASKPTLKARAAEITPDERPGDYAQAIMDLGATVCTPRKPKCLTCPWSDACVARVEGVAEDLPRNLPKKAKPTRRGTCFFVVDRDGSVLLRRRPESGLLGGMQEVPSSPWTEELLPSGDAGAHAPLEGVRWRELPGHVRHTFTHFHLELTVLSGRIEDGPPVADARWWPVDRLGEAALPTVMAKVVRHALRHIA